MENEYQPNSHKYRDAQKAENAEKKEVKSVVKAPTKAKKQTLGKRFAETFLQEDITDVRQYLIYDVIIPGVKDAFLDSLEMLLNGGNRRSSRSSGGTRTNYGKYYKSESGTVNTNRDRSERTAKKGFNFDIILYENFADAQDVLVAMCEEIDRYGSVPVSEYYELSGRSSDFTDNKYGWTDPNIGNIRPRHTRDGYILDLPKAEPLN